jgi:hypothetical protein
MAKKRSQIDATLTVTAASDIFTQDVEELKENGVINAEAHESAEPREPIRQPQAEGEPEASPEESAPVAPGPVANTFMTKIVLAKVDTKTGKNDKGAWKRTYGKGSDGEWYQTFDKTIGANMEGLAGVEVSVIYKIEKSPKGESRNVVSIGPLDDNVPFGHENKNA